MKTVTIFAFLLSMMFFQTYASTQPDRDYTIAASSRDKKDISYIVNTLGMGTTAKIAMSHSELKKAGKRIDPLHPLRFLMVIFKDEKMKASMQSLKDRWFFNDFMDGVSKTMTCEADRNNLKQEHLNDFCSALGIKYSLIQSSIKNRKWEELVLILIKNIPRETKSDRYDM